MINPGPLTSAVVAAALTGALCSGCGGPSSPGDSVPALRGSLVQVDDAVSAHQWALARRRIDALLRTTRSAERSGKITAGQARRIEDAARRLRDRIPHH